VVKLSRLLLKCAFPDTKLANGDLAQLLQIMCLLPNASLGFAEEMSLITGRLLTFLEWITLGVKHLSPNFGQVD
jgi:hypothetical protein